MLLVRVSMSALLCIALLFPARSFRSLLSPVRRGLALVRTPPMFAVPKPRKNTEQRRQPPTSSNQNAKSMTDLDIPVAAQRSFAKTTVWGQNIINCRPFSLDSQKKFTFIGSFTSTKSAPVYPSPEVAFIGRSNVGKSSLLNCLTGGNKKIAIESKTPGRTQCINLFKCDDKEGDIAILADLPGYGYAKISKVKQEQISGFLQEYMVERSSLRVVFVLIDIRREPQDLDRAMLAFLADEGIDCIVVATKVDQIPKTEVNKALDLLRNAFQLPQGQPIPFSSFTGEGRKEVWRAMRDAITGDESNVDGEV